jgi:hypothetical protein
MGKKTADTELGKLADEMNSLFDVIGVELARLNLGTTAHIEVEFGATMWFGKYDDVWRIYVQLPGQPFLPVTSLSIQQRMACAKKLPDLLRVLQASLEKQLSELHSTIKDLCIFRHKLEKMEPCT